ncbi:hypothetical protein EDD18DRAFT_849519 [Armillaria luteobubalina]|uniref:Heterokaryon incompatibility domain-containing protein n=1 Tax=Armillaria luteobubalina TaxID=153913 RepID=A0AA39TSE5_9AGAR|nr:hypothetical protein EDD18DRAFT_849519 [Armillaria luteobubalina]
MDVDGEYDDHLEAESGDYNNAEEERMKDQSLPEVTITSFTEVNRDESTIPAVKQRSYTGRKVIPSAVANTLCADLGVEGVLEKLNAILGTSYTLDSVISVLNPYIAQGFDFGTTYAYLRPFWDDVHTIEHKLRTRENEDREMRQNVLVDGKITTAIVPPRRVWDLYANRVVPYWVALSLGRERWYGISHAWVGDEDRISIMTPINENEWSVPMPKHGSLDLVRIEMLNVGAEYAWLDILCLRQQGGRGEHLRTEEWKLDVPTIGAMYDWDPVVCYFNGLGQPLYLTPSYFESDRCWFRRAWTLQEITENPIIGGETDGDYVMDEGVRKRFDEKLAWLRDIREWDMTLDILAEMRNRVSTKPLDKVAGLVYLLRTESIPIYDAEQSQADAWEVLMDVMAPGFRAEFFFFYPECGNGKKCWRPSWQQVMANRIVEPDFSRWPGQVRRMEETDVDCYTGYRVESAKVRHLADIPNEGEPRRGELVLKDGTGAPHILNIVADHAYPIPDGSYTLICCDADGELPTDIWVAGQLREDETFEKISVFSSAEDEEVKVRQLGFKQVDTILG